MFKAKIGYSHVVLVQGGGSDGVKSTWEPVLRTLADAPVVLKVKTLLEPSTEIKHETDTS